MKEMYKYGIGFWIGAAVISLVNMFQNLKHAPQQNILIYNYYMIGICIIGFILNLTLMKRKSKQK